MSEKKGQVLIENIVFIVLNLAFLSIMILFLLKQSSGVAIVEETYSKQIALLIDSAKPGMIMEINMEDAMKASKDKKRDFAKIINFNRSEVNLDIGNKGGYSYHYFNDVSVAAYPNQNEKGEYTGMYIVTVSRK
jgi:hypothetical protein